MSGFLIKNELDEIELMTMNGDIACFGTDDIVGNISNICTVDITNGYASGIAVSDNEQQMYITYQHQNGKPDFPHFKIYNIDGTFVKDSDVIPGYTPNFLSDIHDFKISTTSNAVYFCVDDYTVAKFSLTGEYIAHYTHSQAMYPTDIIEHITGIVYVSCNSNVGILAFDNNLNFIKSINTINGMGLAIAGNEYFIAKYSQFLWKVSGNGQTIEEVVNATYNGDAVRPFDICNSKNAQYIYITDYNNDMFHMVDITSGQVVKSISHTLTTCLAFDMAASGNSLYAIGTNGDVIKIT